VRRRWPLLVPALLLCALVALATVAFDAATESSVFTTTDPFTFTHTPSGTPRGVLVFIAHNTNSTDLINGTVSADGVSLTRVATNGRACDTAGEQGCTYSYFVGAGVPNEALTISIDHTASTADKIATAITFTGDDDLEVVASCKVENNVANPQCAVDCGSRTCQRSCAIFSGLAAVSSLTPVNLGTVVSDHTALAGNSNVVRVDRETGTSSGSLTVGYTSANDDVGMTCVGVSEVLPPAAAPKRPPVQWGLK